MVRISAAALFALLLVVPAMAQDDYPKIQTSMGYANLSLLSGHHSSFANQTGFNLSRTLGLENYMGIYGLGQGVTLISDFFGGKAMYRTARAVPYALAGIGVGYFTDSQGYGQSSFATRYGAGVDIPINDSLAWKVEVSRMTFHLQTTFTSSWTGGTNFATGIVFTISQ